ncbi:hypothetical protein PED39_00090 [Methanomassiliicoccales archaeon LGM-RCC1]|nr:hypothetical protein PED39_00090 [Methanomassiliicoccales archaeon LGM-RCC1]
MKSEHKAILASLLVVALCLSAVGGVTYSWFSDTETGEIKTSSAVIDIDGVYSDPLVTLTNSPATEYTSDVYGTAASFNDDELDITDLQANRTITSVYTITNKSTVNSLYRLYISVPDVSDSLLNTAIKFYVSGTINGHTLDGTTPIAFNNHLGYAFGDATSGILLPKNTSTGGFDQYALTIKVVTNEGLVQGVLPSEFTISMVSEAYQVDYQYTEPVFMSVGTNADTATVSGTNATTFSASTVPKAAGASSALSNLGAVSVTFPENAMRAIDASATGTVTLNVDVTDAVSTVSSATLELSLTDSQTGPITTFGGEKITVTVVVPYTGPLDITYNGTLDEQPEVLSIVDNGDGTSTVTFQTDHFSGFDLIELDKVQAKDLSTGQYQMSFLDALASDSTAGHTLKLINDFSVSAPILVPHTVTIEGDGKTITTSATRGVRVNGDNVDLTIKDFNLVCGSNTERALQIDNNRSNINIAVYNCDFGKVSYYSINICNGITDANIYIENSRFAGWGAVNIWSANNTFKAVGSTFIGLNDKGYNAEGWNNFGTVVLEADTTSQTAMAAHGNTVTFEDCEIVAKTIGQGNTQTCIIFNYCNLTVPVGAHENVVKLTDCVLDYNESEKTYEYIDNGSYNYLEINGEVKVDNTPLEVQEEPVEP